MQDIKDQLKQAEVVDPLTLKFGPGPDVPIKSDEEHRQARTRIKQVISHREEYGNWVYTKGRDAVICFETLYGTDNDEEQRIVARAESWIQQQENHEDSSLRSVALAVLSLLRIEVYLDVLQRVTLEDVGNLLYERLQGKIFEQVSDGSGVKMFRKHWHVVEAVRDLSYGHQAVDKFEKLKEKAAAHDRREERKTDQEWKGSATQEFVDVVNGAAGLSRVSHSFIRERGALSQRPSVYYWNSNGQELWLELVLGGAGAVYRRKSLQHLKLQLEQAVDDTFSTDEVGEMARREKEVWKFFRLCVRVEKYRLEKEALKAAEAEKKKQAEKAVPTKASEPIADVPAISVEESASSKKLEPCPKCEKVYAPKATSYTKKVHERACKGKES